MVPASAVVAQAREWVGVRFLHQGRERTGADCIGCIAGILSELDLMLALSELPNNYARAPQAELMQACERLCTPSDLRPGVLLLIKLPLTAYPSHAAIYTGFSMIHSDGMRGRIVEHGYGRPWTTRTHSIWALPGVDYS